VFATNPVTADPVSVLEPGTLALWLLAAGLRLLRAALRR